MVRAGASPVEQRKTCVYCTYVPVGGLVCRLISREHFCCVHLFVFVDTENLPNQIRDTLSTSTQLERCPRLQLSLTSRLLQHWKATLCRLMDGLQQNLCRSPSRVKLPLHGQSSAGRQEEALSLRDQFSPKGTEKFIRSTLPSLLTAALHEESEV